MAKVITNTNSATLHGFIAKNIKLGAVVCADGHRRYLGLGGVFYDHKVVCHSAKEYVKGMVHTNGIESVWTVLKRGYNGIYHNWSMKHMGRYINEYSFRLNEGNCKRTTLARLDSLILKAVGKRLTYKELIS